MSDRTSAGRGRHAEIRCLSSNLPHEILVMEEVFG